MIYFAWSQWKILFLLLPAVAVFLFFVHRSKKRALGKFGAPALLQRLVTKQRTGIQLLKYLLLFATLFFVVVSLMRPQWGTKLELVKRRGVDIIIAVDTSLSMQAEDIKPNRLESAKREISELLNTLTGDRVGLVAFAGKAFLQCPLTLDYGAVRIFLDVLNTELIPEPGTAIADAIRVARKAFSARERKFKVLVIITDGEDHEGDPVKEAEEAQKEGVIVFTIGIGSPEGVPIPLYGEGDHLLGHKKDREGKVVLSALNERTLREIALAGEGKYYRASGAENEIEQIYEEISRLDKKELESKLFSQREDRFQYFVLIAFVCLALETAIADLIRLFPVRKKNSRGSP
jgi:Ca-activated chloride channel family protein